MKKNSHIELYDWLISKHWIYKDIEWSCVIEYNRYQVIILQSDVILY